MTKTMTLDGKRLNLVSIGKEIGKIWKMEFKDIVVDTKRKNIVYGANGSYVYLPFDELEQYTKGD